MLWNDFFVHWREQEENTFYYCLSSGYVAVLLLSAGGHCGGDAEWGQGFWAETQRHYHPTRCRWYDSVPKRFESF